MDAITMIGLVWGASQLLKKKTPTTPPPTDAPGTETTSKPNLSGSPSLTIRDIQKFPIDKVEFTLSGDGQEIKGKHQAKNEVPTIIRAGKFTLIAITDPEIRPGQKKPDVVMLNVKDDRGRTVIAKRILIDDKKIIDIV